MSGYSAARLAGKYMTKQRKNIVLIFEDIDMDWTWDESELNLLIELYNSGHSIEGINRVLKRVDPDEIFLALFYLAKKGDIEKLDLRQLKGE